MVLHTIHDLYPVNLSLMCSGSCIHYPNFHHFVSLCTECSHWLFYIHKVGLTVILDCLTWPNLRTITKYLSHRYSKDDDLDDIERDLGDEYGWKQVHYTMLCYNKSMAGNRYIVQFLCYKT